MAGNVIVLVTDRDDSKHGEITVVGNAKKAERLVETLLEAGFEPERIRVFQGGEMGMQVTHRPVVSLLGEGRETAESAPDDADTEGKPEAGEGKKGEEAEKETEGEPESVEGRVRFSSLFRSS